MKGIICLCGSTRFFEHFRLANLKLTCADWIVLSIGIDTKSDKQLEEAGMTVDKVQLDRLHHDKIALAQAIMVIDVDGYVGDSTRNEIEHAARDGKLVYSYSQTKDFTKPREFNLRSLNCHWCDKPIMPSQGSWCSNECMTQYSIDSEITNSNNDYK